jgi:hypothetical protein
MSVIMTFSPKKSLKRLIDIYPMTMLWSWRDSIAFFGGKDPQSIHTIPVLLWVLLRARFGELVCDRYSTVSDTFTHKKLHRAIEDRSTALKSGGDSWDRR